MAHSCRRFLHQAAIGVNYVDLSPHYPGLFFAIGNTIANVAGLLAPIVVGNILGPGNVTHREHQWNQVFYISSAVLIGALVVFGALAKGKPQSSLN